MFELLTKFLQLIKFRYFITSYLVVFVGFELVFVNYLYRDVAMGIFNVFGQSDTTFRLLTLFIINFVDQLVIFFIFCFLFYGGIYILNDVKDVEHDRFHPVKKSRPLVEGCMNQRHAIILGIVMISISLILSIFYNLILSYFLIFFLIINLSYTFAFRNFPYLDVIFNGFTHPLRFQLGMRMCHLMFFTIGTDLLAEFQYLIVTFEFFFLAMIISIKKRQMEASIAPESRPTSSYYEGN
ncbi:MAG: UbiA family prenyltransferase [Candidatus Helarchaeales archaeon]